MDRASRTCLLSVLMTPTVKMKGPKKRKIRKEGNREDGEDASGGEERMRKGAVGRVKRPGSTRRQSRVDVRSESILYHHWPNILVFLLLLFVKLDRNIPRSE